MRICKEMAFLDCKESNHRLDSMSNNLIKNYQRIKKTWE